MTATTTCAFSMLALLAFCPAAEAKLESGTISLGGDGNRWSYLAKFGYATGAGSTYEIRFRQRQQSTWTSTPAAQDPMPAVDVDVYLDEEWDFAMTLPECRRAAEGKARRNFPSVHRGIEPGAWGPWIKGKVSQTVRPHIWYFAASSCSSHGPAVTFDYEVRMRQPDGSELGVELRWMPLVSAAILVVLTGFLVRFVQRCQAQMRSAGSLHEVIVALGSAVALQWAALALEALHLWLYRGNGVGAPLADATSGILDMLSQVVNATLLIAIAHGFSLAHSGPCQLSQLKPMVAGVAALHVALVVLDKCGGESAYEHHENGGALGLVLLAARLTLFGWFAKGLSELRSGAGLKLQAFLQHFQVAASAYLAAYPLLFMAVQAFAPYLRHPLLQMGLLTAQTASAFWLADLFLSRGAFYEVSTLSGSFLPSSGRPACSDDRRMDQVLRRRGGC